MSTLAGLPIIRANVSIPPSGAWVGTFALNASKLPALGRAVLAIGDLQLVGAIIRTDFDDHPGGGLVTATARGGAGWRLQTAREGVYASESGVRLSTVLQDVARLAGETYAAPADTSLGVGYRWEKSEPLTPVHYESVLHDLVARGYVPTWRAAPSGETRFDAWPSIGAADGRGRITDRHGARDRRTVGLDVQVAAFLPGATLEGAVIQRTILRETADSLEALVYVAPATSAASPATPAGSTFGRAGAGGIG